MSICKDEKEKFLNAYKSYFGRYGQYVKGSLGETLGFIPVDEFESYNETPSGSVIFAMTGTGGCHYCMVEDGDNINIYNIFPNRDENQGMYLIGHSICEVLSYALSIHGLFECVFDYEKDEFLQVVKEVGYEIASQRNDKCFKSDLIDLSNVYAISEFSPSEVYSRLRSMNGFL